MEAFTSSLRTQASQASRLPEMGRNVQADGRAWRLGQTDLQTILAAGEGSFFVDDQNLLAMCHLKIFTPWVSLSLFLLSLRFSFVD